MISGISTFTNLPTPVKVGLLVVSGGGIMAAIRYLPRNILLVIFIGLAVVALLVLLYWRLLKWLKKRKAAPMEQNLMDNTAATPQGISKPAHMARLDDLRKQFERGVEKFHAAGKSLYGFPWYMIVGEPGSGKTEAIRHCNVGFPPGLQDEFQGTGGTLNMNWWFTDYAVILDTAGRLMFEEVETGGSSEWKEFLNLLKKYRTRCPVNGVLLVIPVDSLIKDTADEIEQKASKIARQFDLIQRALDVRFPVFVVITKSDLLNGFRDFFDNLDDPQLQHQILGWSNPAPLDEPYNPDFINQHLEAIRGRLFRRRLALMQEVISDESGAERMRSADTLYAFPQSLIKIAPRMARYLELIFSVGSQWSCKPLFFRGIYFTSSMREGSALDEDLAESLGVPVDSLPDGRVWERDRAYFLRDLFMKKVFREQGLVTYATNAKKLHSRRKAAVLIAAAASVIILLFFTIYGWTRFDKSIGEMEYYLGAPAALIDPSEPKKLQNELQVIKPKGEDRYDYIGSAGIYVKRGRDVEKPEKLDVERFEFPARLARTISRWEKKGIPWIFKLAATFAEDITRKDSRKAQAVVYKTGVLQPFLIAARDMMDTQENGQWTYEDTETRAMCQLIRFKANRPLNEKDEYSAEAFLDPLFEYVFGRVEEHEDEKDTEKRITYNNMYKEHKDELHLPLAVMYGDPNDEDKLKLQWPPVSLRTDPNSRDAAIEQGVKLFNEYWTDPNRLGAHNRDYAQVEIMERLKNALEDFNDAEQRILSLRDKFDHGEWNESFISLKEARESIDNYDDVLKRPQSLEELWSEVAKNVLQKVNENYDFLLNELDDPNKVKKEHFLGGIRDTLEAARTKIINKLRKSEFEERLRQLDRGFWTQLRDGSHLYEIRFEMYSKANEQLAVLKSISELNQVTKAIEEAKRAVREARRKIDEQLKLGRSAFRFKEANDISRSALGLAEQRQLYNIVNDGLVVAPKSIKELEELIEKEAKRDWTAIPAEIIERKYDPNATATALTGWKVLGDTLKNRNYHFPEQTRLNGTYEDANGIYTEYTSKCLDYWLENVPVRWIESKIPREDNWKAQHKQLEKLDVLDVFRELRKFGKSIEEEVLDKFENYIPDGDEKVKQFRDSAEKLSDISFERKCDRTLERWGGLRDDAFEARNTLLNSRPIPLVKVYFPFPARLPAEFVDTYWIKLTVESLRILANQTQRGGKEAFNELKKEYGSKFPLARDSMENLTIAQLNEARSLLGRIQTWQEQYEPGTVGRRDTETELDEVNKQLERLREIPLPESDREWTRAIRQVFQGLPEGETPYYCKVVLLSEDKQNRFLREDGIKGQKKLLVADLRAFKFVQGRHESLTRKTGSPRDLNVDTVEYPGPPIRIEFYRYLDDSKPWTSLPFSEPWAPLRMLHQYYLEGRKGCIRLDVPDKEGLGGVLYLQLEFCSEYDGKSDIDLPKPNDWPSLKR